MTASMPLLDLDDGEAVTAADAEGLLRAVAMGGAQIRSTAAAVADGVLGRLIGFRPRSVILIAGSGGARHAARLAIALAGNSIGAPLLVLEHTPSWAGPLDVVVVAGDDAGDPRLVESVDSAVRRGAEVVVAVPDEGPMRAAAAGRTAVLAPRLYVPPRHTMTRFLAVFLAVGAVIEDRSPHGRPWEALDRVADAVDAEAVRSGPGREVFGNPAKSLATRMLGHRVVVCGNGSVATVLSEYASAALLASGISAAAADLSDVIRGARMLYAPRAVGGDSVFHDPFFHDPQLDGALPGESVRAFVFTTEADQADTRRRMDALADADLVVSADDDQSDPGISEMEQVFVLASRVDMAAAYAQLTGGA
ncbi:hypothetical protein ABH922_002897 [Rhodococcus sp. 27YEA15]|uniref:tobH protein n=1 Tax=Rhodococcus sp. 27YEA15 TaxID=3156259 RepID=UPI003C7D9E6A